MWRQRLRLARGASGLVCGLTQKMAQGIAQQRQHGRITLVKLKQVVHVPKHPHQLAPVANLLRGPQAAGQRHGAGSGRAHHNNPSGLELHGSRPENIGIGRIGILPQWVCCGIGHGQGGGIRRQA